MFNDTCNTTIRTEVVEKIGAGKGDPQSDAQNSHESVWSEKTKSMCRY